MSPTVVLFHFPPSDTPERTADDGEKHIADVKTVHGSVIEFQHSFITSEERLSRDNFYPKKVLVYSY